MASRRKRSESESSRSSGFCSSSDDVHQKRRVCKKHNGLPKDATRIMNLWLFENRYNPYPSEAVKREIVHQTGLTPCQVSNYFINARRRHVTQWFHLQGKTDDESREILRRRGHSSVKKKDYQRIKRMPKPPPGLTKEELVVFFRKHMKGCAVDKVPEGRDRELYEIYFENVFRTNPENCAAIVSDDDVSEYMNIDGVLRPVSNMCNKSIQARSRASTDKENLRVVHRTPPYQCQIDDSDYYNNPYSSSIGSPGSSYSSDLDMLAGVALKMERQQSLL